MSKSNRAKPKFFGSVGAIGCILWGYYGHLSTALQIPSNVRWLVNLLADPPTYLPWLLMTACIALLAWAFWPVDDTDFENGTFTKQKTLGHGAHNLSGIFNGPVTINGAEAQNEESKKPKAMWSDEALEGLNRVMSGYSSATRSNNEPAAKLNILIANRQRLENELPFMKQTAENMAGLMSALEQKASGARQDEVSLGVWGMMTEKRARVSEVMRPYGLEWIMPDHEKTKAFPDERGFANPQERERYQMTYYQVWKDYTFFQRAADLAEEKIASLNNEIGRYGK